MFLKKIGTDMMKEERSRSYKSQSASGAGTGRAARGPADERITRRMAEDRPARRVAEKRSARGMTEDRTVHKTTSDRPARKPAENRSVRQTASSGSRTRSRYPEKSGTTSARARGAGKRTGSRRNNRKRNAGRWRVLLLICLVLVAVCLAGAYVLTQNRQKRLKAESVVREQISVNLDSLESPYAVLMDGATGTVLATKQGDETIFPASMAKIMTVLTAIESIRNLDETVTMSYDIYDELYARDASRAGFEPGEEAKIRDLLYGALLPSGAECCVQLAICAAGSESAFVDQMNQKAAELGLTQTHFANATGLHSEEQYSTPHEIGEILQAALKNKTFYKVFTTHSYTVQPTAVHPDGFTFWSTLFKNIEEDTVNGGKIMGGKTGYTDEAGHCLASMAEVNGREYILVTAGWAQATDDTLYHINDAFRAYNQIAQ